MPMLADDIVKLITQNLPGAQVEITALVDDGDHYKAVITWDGFNGLARVKQHQKVYAALEGRMGGELHALALETRTPQT